MTKHNEALLERVVGVLMGKVNAPESAIYDAAREILEALSAPDEAAPASGVEAVPEGWKAVPTEPPWETLIAGRDALMDTDDEIDLSTDQIRECYRAMLASIKKVAHV